MTNDVVLHLGDCLEYMRGMDAGSVDAVITDPPYGVDFDGASWDGFIPQWLADARRIAEAVLFTTAPTTVWSYPPADWIGCWYRTAAQSRNKQGGFNHWTPVLMYGHVRFSVDTFYSNGMVTAAQNARIEHPTPKDLGMVRWLVGTATRPGDLVFDPFMGSGTTGVACVQTGRRFIGCEISPEYFQVAQRRIADAQARPRLFDDLPAAPAKAITQGTLLD